MKIIYGVCSWGLGHATRSLPVIRKLVAEGHDLTVISNGRSLTVLKKELGDGLEYVDIPDYPMLLSENARQFMAKSMVYWPKFIGGLKSGFDRVKKLLGEQKFDRIVSDARYDVYNRDIPSFFISHQMRIMNPLRIKFLESGSEVFNLFFFKRFAGVIVPDFKEDDISGDLSHNLKKIEEKKLHYVGVLSDFNKKDVRRDIDYLISISGPEPGRSFLEEKLLSQIDVLDGRVVVTLGKSEEVKKLDKDNVEVFTFVSKKEREDLLNRANLVVSRSGYSTISDLSVLGTRALMTPTPGQIEQGYLSEYHNDKGTFYSVEQDDLDLSCDVDAAKKFSGVKRSCDVDKSVEKIVDIVMTVDSSPF